MVIIATGSYAIGGLIDFANILSEELSSVKTQSKSKTQSDSLITLYRAVSPAEDESIQKTGIFLNPEFIESKYFSLTKEGAK